MFDQEDHLRAAQELARFQYNKQAFNWPRNQVNEKEKEVEEQNKSTPVFKAGAEPQFPKTEDNP